MTKNNYTLSIPDEIILNKIYLIRNQKVMIDIDLAQLYKVETKRLNEQVRRNIKRFPEDFMFQLTEKEFGILKSQFATSSWGGKRKLPFVFTEHGVLMLSSILSSDIAISVNIKIMRVFTQIRNTLANNEKLNLLIDEISKRTENNTNNIELIFQYIDELTLKKENQKPIKKIGFKIPKKSLK
ncbi:MAG: ORF6N domain-containing protein [Bacteroidetes bacterium]|nr:ORF6N domain-containing protein [Bacteroidota bacterium]